MIRIVLIDDDPLVRESLATILSAQSDVEVCATGGSVAEAKALFFSQQPDILLLDIQMGAGNGLDAAEAILAQDKAARIVFLTTFSDDEYIVRALRMGSKGYLIKTEVANIAPALRSVMSGQSVLAGEVLGKVDELLALQAPLQANVSSSHEFAANQRSVPSIAGLTDRESQVLQLVAEGMDNKEIAEALFFSEGTVRNRISTILAKLGCKNRTQLAIYYYRHAR